MDDFEKELEKGFDEKNNISSKTIILILITGIVVFLLGALFVVKMGIKTDKQKEAEAKAAEKATIVTYDIQLTKGDDFYKKSYIFHQGICYVTLKSTILPSDINEELGETTSQFEYTKAPSTVTDGMRYGLTEGQKYYSVNNDTNIIAVKANGGYRAFVNEDFYDIYQKSDDFQKIIDDANNINDIEIEVATNGINQHTIMIAPKTFQYILNNMSTQEYKMNSTEYESNIASDVTIFMNTGIGYTYKFGYSVKDKIIFCYRYTDGNLSAYIFKGGDKEELNTEIFEIFSDSSK